MFKTTLKTHFIMPIAFFLTVTFLTSCVENQTDAPSRNQIGSSSSLMTLSNETRAEIESAIFDKYLGGQKMKSANIIRSAFNKDSVMLYPTLDADGNYGLKRWLNMHELAVEWAEQSSSDMDLRKFEILSMDVVDDRIAVVTLKVEDRVFDAITLVKEADDWKIASKVYISKKS